jgi:hypothetical protein
MSKQDFLKNLRVARNLFAHPRVFADSHQLDPADLQKTIAGAAIWLTPKSVRGFRAEDFAELGADRQRELTEAVEEFESVANQLPPTQPATTEQLNKAVAAFSQIVAILDSYLPTPQEENAIVQALKDLKLVAGVVNWNHELGSDEDGVPAVWITVYLDESKIPRTQYGRFASELTSRARQLLSDNGIQRWPYLRLRTPAEHRSL